MIPSPGSKVLVHPPITGTLVARENTPALGAAVKAGDVIAFVQPAFGEFSSKLIEAEAEAIRASTTGQGTSFKNGALRSGTGNNPPLSKSYSQIFNALFRSC